MSFVKAAGKGIGILLFSLMLSAAIFSMGIADVTEYENMKGIFSEVMSPQMEQSLAQQDVQKTYNTILELCEGRDSIDVPITEGGKTFELDCNQMRSIQVSEGSEEFESLLTDMAVSAVFQMIYYQEYNCEFLVCMSNGEYGAILSPKGHQFFLDIQQPIFIGAIIGLAILVSSTETWESRMKSAGVSMFFVGIIYFVINYVRDWAISHMSPDIQTGMSEVGMSMSPVLDSVFRPMMTNLLITFVAGVALFVLGAGIELHKRRSETPAKKGQ